MQWTSLHHSTSVRDFASNTSLADVAERLTLSMRETLKEHGKEPGCNLSANSQAPPCRAGWPKTVCYFCVLFSVPNKPLHALLHPDRESGYTAPSLWSAKGASLQVPAPDSLWGINHSVGSGFILEDALCIPGSAVPQEPKAGGKLPCTAPAW